MKYTPDFSSRFRILKGGKISLVVSAMLMSATLVHAAPIGGSVTTGSASIDQTGSVTTITQSTNKASINWQDFSIGKSETVNFIQPSASSVTLNRVVGTSASLIDGVMNANGQVFLINPNGVLFSKDATVNVGGLVASTLNITDENFQAGNYSFEGNSQNSVLNMGTITTAQGGYIAMIGKTVQNEGTIVATMGNVQLAGGDKISLNLNGNSLVKLTINEGTLNALVENKGAIIANGGQVYLTTQALNTILDGMVNNTGIIEAQSLNNVDGKVVLYAHGGTLNAGGTIDTGNGTGSVETSGEVFTSDNTLHVSTGSWLIDPTDLTVDSTLAGTINSTLSGGADVTETATGNINVNSGISWSSAQTLTLGAGENIYINASITSTNASGKLSLLYGQGAVANGNTANYYVDAPINLASGQNFSTTLGSDGTAVNYTVVNGATELQNMNNGLSGNYALGSNVDLNGVTWTPIGLTYTNPFAGKFDGLGHTISNLTINDTTGNNSVGLFRYGVGSTISNIGIVGGSVTGGDGALVGGLVGLNGGTITNAYATGSVIGGSGGAILGGLVGENYGTISNAYATGSVSGGNYDALGGLVGENDGAINNAYATGSVSSGTIIGGLVGLNDGSINNAYATGSVTNGAGFVGNNPGGTFTNSFWDTTTSGQSTSNGGTGLSTADMQKLATFSVWGSDIVGDASLSNVYPQLRWATSGLSAGNSIWVIGSALSGGGSSGSSGSSSTTDNTISNIVTTIVNSTIVTALSVVIPPLALQPSVTQTQTAQLLQNIMPQSNGGENFKLVGTTDGNNAVQTVSMDDLQKGSQSGTEIRVPMGHDSLVELINGGVNLPLGVSQEFYVVNNNNQEIKN